MSYDLQKHWTSFRSAPGENTFSPFYDASKNLVYTICYRILRNQDDAHDAFQATYGRLLQVTNDPDAAGRVTDAAQLIRYLAVREADNLRKRRSRRLHREMTMETLPPNAYDPNLSPGEIAANRQLREQVETIVSTLPERYRLPVLLHYFNGMTHQEIAQALGEPRSTITRRIGRALKKLQPIMRRAGLGEASATLGAIMAAGALLSPPASWAAGAIYTSASATAAAGAGAVGAAQLVSGATAASGKAAATGLAAVKGWLAATAAAVVIGGGVIVATMTNAGTSPSAIESGEVKSSSGAPSAIVVSGDAASSSDPSAVSFDSSEDGRMSGAKSPNQSSGASDPSSSAKSQMSGASASSDAPDSTNKAAALAPADANSFQVRVIWDKTKESVQATTVTAALINKARDNSTYSALTDDKGISTIQLPKSWDAIHLSVIGQPAALNPERDAALPAAQPFEIALERGASIYGHVFIQGTTKPAAGADVTIWGDWKRTKAAADGSYEIFGLAPGEIRIFSRHGALLSFLREDELDKVAIIEGLRNGPHDIIVKPVLAVEGRITNKATGQPIAGARVDAGLDFLASTTGADGRYRVEGLYAKSYTINAKADGYVGASSQYTMDDSRPNILDLALEPGASANVLVVDESGAPVPAARILNDRGSVHDRKGETGDDGKIVVTGLSPTDAETGYLYAQKEGYNSSARIKPMFSQSTVTPSITLTLTRDVRKAGVFAGRVTDESGEPLENVTVRFSPAWRHSFVEGNKTITNASGEYTLHVEAPQSSWRLTAFVEGRAPDWKYNVVPGTAEQPSRVDFKLGPPHWLELQVQDEQKNPVSGVWIVTGPNDEMRSQDYFPGNEINVETPPNGLLRFDNLPATDVKIEVSGDGWTRHQEVVAVDKRVTVTLRPDGILKGRVVDAVTGDPITKFNIKVNGSYVSWELIRGGINFNDAESRFTIPGLQLTESYSVIVEAEGYAVATTDKLSPALADEAKEIEIKLREGKTLKGRLVETDGVTPIAGAPVVFGQSNQAWAMVNWDYIMREGGNMQARQNAVTDEEGRFNFNDISEDGTLVIRAPGFVRLLLEPSDQEPFKQDGELIIPVARGAGIQGTYALNGAAQSGVRMSLSISSKIINGRQRYENFEQSTADSFGRFDWKDLAAGSYEIHPYESRGRMSFGRFSLKVELKAAETKEINIADHLGALTLSGRVRMGEEPIEDATFTLTPQFDWTISRFTDHTTAQGNYNIFGLRPGKYLINLYKTTEQGVITIQHNETITLTESLTKDINLADRHKIVGQLVFDAKVPATDRSEYKSISIVRANATIDELVTEAETNLGSDGQAVAYNGTGDIDNQGRITIMGRFKGLYQLTLVKTGSRSQAASITIPEVFTIDTTEADHDLGTIKVPDTGSIEFTIHSDGPINSDNFGAILLNEFGRVEGPQWGDPINLNKNLQTQVISPVRAGSFRVGVFALGYKIDPNMIPITIEPGQTGKVEVHVKPMGMILGTTHAQEGNVTSMAQLSQVTVKGPGLERTVLPIAGGMEDLLDAYINGKDAVFANQFIIQNLEDGEYDVTIEAAGYETVIKTYKVIVGEKMNTGEVIYMTKNK